mmetsp:Transcript_21501/g.69210  ORF Transcript_21501/g.69210 Transcript_21501/m.69210 type:complete len:207 (-) Transcript_21501:92-712(-)
MVRAAEVFGEVGHRRQPRPHPGAPGPEGRRGDPGGAVLRRRRRGDPRLPLLPVAVLRGERRAIRQPSLSVGGAPPQVQRRLGPSARRRRPRHPRSPKGRPRRRRRLPRRRPRGANAAAASPRLRTSAQRLRRRLEARHPLHQRRQRRRPLRPHQTTRRLRSDNDDQRRPLWRRKLRETHRRRLPHGRTDRRRTEATQRLDSRDLVD